MKKTSSSKLVLDRSTIRRLDNLGLSVAVGGAINVDTKAACSAEPCPTIELSVCKCYSVKPTCTYPR